MKKLLAMVMVLCLFCCSSALALRGEAEGEYTGNTDQTATTEVKVTIDEIFTVVIPPAVTIDFNAEATPITIKVTDLRLVPGHFVYVQPQNYGKLVDSTNQTELAYTLTGLTTKGTVTNALFFEQLTEGDGNSDLKITISTDTWNATPAGSYSGEITFKIAIGTF